MGGVECVRLDLHVCVVWGGRCKAVGSSRKDASHLHDLDLALDVVDVALALERRLLDDFDCEFLLGRLQAQWRDAEERASVRFTASVTSPRKNACTHARARRQRRATNLLRALVGDAKRAASEFLAHVVVRRKVRGISKHVTDLHTSRRRCRVRGAGGARIGRGHTIPHPLAAAFDLRGLTLVEG